MNRLEILDRIRKLPEKDRLLIAQVILDDLKKVDHDIEAAWLEEASQRLQAVKEGEIKTVPGEEVLQKARNILEKGKE